MKFTELEQIMFSQGTSTLADIARALDTTPQAVSNWKARDQVPYHVVAKLSQASSHMENNQKSRLGVGATSSPLNSPPPSLVFEKESLPISDVILTLAEQLKVIVLVPFITVFLTFTYVQFIQQPEYVSRVSILLPENKAGSLGGLAGLASQFGVNVPTETKTDLSSPSLFPKLLTSRTFAEKILDKKFYTKKYSKELSLLAILTHGEKPPKFGRDTLITQALKPLKSLLGFEQDRTSSFSIITVTAFEPVFAKELAEVTIAELEKLNRYYKSQAVNEKTSFISNRISSVENDLESSEKRLKEFSERNRQISSPSLQLDFDRLTREVEIQKGVYLTLKQQLELAKIEEVQEVSIVQVLDKPQVALGPSNINLRRSVLFAAFLGIGLGIMLGFVRSYTNNSDIGERKKLRRVRYFFKKKTKDFILDYRISGIVSLLLLIGLPYYLGHKSKIPVFFGLYSSKLMFVNTVYILTLIASISLCIYLVRKKA